VSRLSLSLRVVGATGLVLVAAAPAAAHGPVDPTPPDIGILLTAWRFEPTVAIPLALSALAWLWIVDRIDGRHPGSHVPLYRTLAFLGGLGVVAIALMSGIERYDTTLFQIHMVQHLLLVLVAPPLLLLGAPITQLLRVASPWLRRRVILPFLQSTPMLVLSHPVTAWLAFTGVMWLSHFSPLFDLALEDPGVHELEHVLYLVSALLFWFPVVGADPGPRRLPYPARALYLLLQMPVGSFLAMAILFADTPLYQHYATLGSPYGIDPLADQQAAAGIMWVVADAVYLAAILFVLGAWMRHEERGTVAAERRLDVERAALAERADRLAAVHAAERAASGPSITGQVPGGQAPPGPSAGGEASSSR
jgi:putative membrane protein